MDLRMALAQPMAAGGLPNVQTTSQPLPMPAPVAQATSNPVVNAVAPGTLIKPQVTSTAGLPGISTPIPGVGLGASNLTGIGGVLGGGNMSNIPVVGGLFGGGGQSSGPQTKSGGIAGALGDVLGTSNNFQASMANLTPGTNTDQLNTAYQGAQSGLGQQQDFVNALNAQNGIGNQSSVFAQQQGLANQLGERAAGGGPNPALAQFQNATGQNIAQQAALMGSQRGASANPGMMARQAAMQGANIQQQAAGQAAVQQAQQQAQMIVQAQQQGLPQ